MSPTGTPDYNQNPASNNSSPAFDSGEDTTRLLMGGGAQSRAGRWIWATGFENGLGEFVTTTGAGVIETGATRCYQGAACLKLSTNGTINDTPSFRKYIFTQGINYGFECMIAFTGLTTGAHEIRWIIAGPSQIPNHRSLVYIVLVITTSNVANLYLDINGSRTLISNLNNYIDDNSQYYHYFKMVFNTKENKVSRIYFDDLVFDLGGTPGWDFTPDSRRLSTFQIELKSLTAIVNSIYIDNVILTTDEP